MGDATDRQCGPTVHCVGRASRVAGLACLAMLAMATTSCGPHRPQHADASLIALDVRTGRPQYSVALGFPVVTGLAVGERNGHEAWVSGSGRHGSDGHDGDVCDGRNGTVRAVDMASARVAPTTPPGPTFGNGSNVDNAPWADAAGVRVTQVGGAG